MKLKFTLHRSGQPEVDLVATVDATTTVGQLAGYLQAADPARAGGRHPGGSPSAGDVTLGMLDARHRMIDPTLPLGESGLVNGVAVSVLPAGGGFQDPDRVAAATLVVLSGPDAGREYPLYPGGNVIGRERGCEVQLTDPLVSRQHARIVVTDGAEIVDLRSANGVVIGDGAIVTRRTRLRATDTVSLGDTVLSVRMLRPASGPSRAEGTTLGFIRPPRLDRAYEGVEHQIPEPPERPGTQRFPIIALVAPVIVGAVLYLITKSIASLAFVALSPLMLVGNAVESRTAGKSAYKKALAAFRADLTVVATTASEELGVEHAVRHLELPSTSSCLAAADAGDSLLWARRPGERGFLELRLGVGSLPSRSHFALPDERRTPRDLYREIRSRLDPLTVVDDVPVRAAPLEDGAVGIGGPRPQVLSLARALLAQIACLHSPAEVVITAVASSQSRSDWDWLKWLPHSSSVHSPGLSAQLTSTGSEGNVLLSELEDLVQLREEQDTDGSTEPSVVLLVEGDAPVEHGRLVGIAERGWRHGVVVLWIASDVSVLPASCRTFVDLSASQEAKVGFVHTGAQVAPVTVEGLSADDVTRLGRRLSPLEDVGASVEDDSDLPRAAPLLQGDTADLGSAPLSIIERWTQSRSVLTGPFAPDRPARREGTLHAVIGMSASGPHSLDLRADGPHALVGGTTGSGKSELLQTWILAMASAHSPQRLSFLLVDYKGGSAFGECASLPHTVGLVTDLSPHLVHRALTSLKAELRHRERVLQHHDAKDLPTLEKRGVLDAPPSLVIVVDEFAALATEVPEFVDGVVDVAQRGRSLGLHLILATQRPAGVIKDNLRANTNLRLALRVADEAESTDVLGSTQAAFFDPALPGRAVSKTGPGRLVPFQTYYGGGWTSDTPSPPDILVTELPFGVGSKWEPDDDLSVTPDNGPNDIQRVVANIGAASKLAELPVPRRPWLPELAAVYDLADQDNVPTRRRDDELVFGVRDDPDNQSQPTIAFRPDEDGNLVVYGTGGSGKSTLLRSLAIAAGFTVRGGPCHVYGIDFGARGLAMLEALPHVGSIISGSDHERITRLLSWLRALIDDRAARYSAVNAGSLTQYRERSGETNEPRILLVVDGIAAFRQAYESTDRIRWIDLLTAIAADGRPVGVHLLLSSDQRSGMSTALASAVQRRVVMRMATDDDYSMLGVPADVLPIGTPPGRGLARDAEIQVAVLGGTSDLSAQALAVRAFADAMRKADMPAAPPIGSLPEDITLDQLPSAIGNEPVVGVSSETLSAFGIQPRGSFLLTGPPGSGRSTALATLAAAVRRAHPDAELHYFGVRRSTLAQSRVWTSSSTTMDQITRSATDLTDRLTGPFGPSRRVVVVMEAIDDLAGSAADMALQSLVKAVGAAEQLVIAEAESSTLMSGIGLLGAIKASRTGLALQPDQGEGQTLFRTSFPRTVRSDYPPGRGFLVRGGRTTVVQLARDEGAAP